MAVATSISQARGLLLVVGTEWDVYSAGAGTVCCVFLPLP